MSNINRNKLTMSKLETQYSSQKKITRPSDDPIVAVRALKLRQNLNELNQYYERNIPDAKSWMEATEGALTNINTVLTKVYAELNNGSNGTLTAEDRKSIIANLVEMKNQIYQEGNTSYAGRHVLTGYKTDTGLVFEKDTNTYEYTINEKFSGNDIKIEKVISGMSNLSSYDPATSTGDSFKTNPSSSDVYKLNMGYGNINATAGSTIDITVDNVKLDPPATVVSSTDPNAYVDDGTLKFIAETGELIIPKDMYGDMRSAKEINVSYSKNSFDKNELRPEHYFDCTKTPIDPVTGDPTGAEQTYVQSKQVIEYEVNFGQKLAVNVQASDCISHEFARMIDELETAISNIETVENQISEVDKLLQDDSLSKEQEEALTNLREKLDLELALRNDQLEDKFNNGLETTMAMQDKMNEVIADVGSRYVRLELIEDRLSTQQVEFEELLSKNEDVDMVETVIKYNTQEVIYNASLSAAAKISKNTLLDFL